MKHLMTLVVAVSVLAMTGLLSAVPTFTPRPVENAGYGGKPFKGIEGTVGELGDSSFSMTSTAGKEGATITWIVKCDSNTKFMSGGQRVSPSAIKPGVHVAVLGGQNGHDLMANTVTIGESKK